MKPFPAHMREKRRYIIFEVVSEGKHDKQTVMKAVWDVVFENIGIFGAAEAAFWVIDFDEESQTGIIRCTNKGVDMIRACLALLGNISNKKAFIHIIKVTGTIKKAEVLKTTSLNKI